jgi:hypothetical protein
MWIESRAAGDRANLIGVGQNKGVKFLLEALMKSDRHMAS